MARPKSKGAYVPLAAQYFMDDAVLEAGPDAELLFVRCLSFLAAIPSDGFITERQVRSVVGLGLRNVTKRLTSLQEVGLLEATEGGFVVRSWTKWNKTAEDIGKLLAKDRQRKAHKSGGNVGNSERNPSGNGTDSSLQSRAEQSSTEQSSNSSSDADASDPEFSADVHRLCDLLAELIRLNSNKVGTVGKAWWLACDRLMRIDGYTPAQVEWVMRWSQQNEFWQGNILSMARLRAQFDQLKTRAMNESKAHKPTRSEENISVVAQYAAMEQNMQGGISA